MITRLNAALAALLVLALILLAVVLVAGSRVLPWTTAAERKVDTYAAVQEAATRSVLAFLDVDFEHMDEKQKLVESLATGGFKKQYQGTAETLKAAVQQAKAVSKGDVRYVGVRSLKGPTATALVAASAVTKNTATKNVKSSDACPHDGAACKSYRLLVTMTDTADGWKMSDLAEVP